MKIVKYQDFSIRFGPRNGDGYPISVSAGQTTASQGFFRVPFTDDELFTLLDDLGAAVRGSDIRHGARDLAYGIGTAPAAERLENAGSRLFHSLFSRHSWLYNYYLGRVEALRREADENIGLRILLHFDSRGGDLPRLSNLPWELLYDEERRSFLTQRRHTPIVRCLAASQPYEPIAFTPPLRILVAIARPSDLSPLDLTEERRLLEKAWRHHPAVEVTILDRVTEMKLREALLQRPFNVIHFMGHGTFESDTEHGALILEKSDGTSDAVSGIDLADRLVGDFPSLHLVVLNACETARVTSEEGYDALAGVATALVAKGLPAVVAMQFPISDAAALSFTRIFYTRLASMDPVDAAVAEARLAILSGDRGSLEWCTPVLYTRSREGRPFLRLEGDPESEFPTSPPEVPRVTPGRLREIPASILTAGSFAILFLVSLFSVTPSLDLTDPHALSAEGLFSGQMFLFTLSFALGMLASIAFALLLLPAVRVVRSWELSLSEKLKRLGRPSIALFVAASCLPIAWSTRTSIHSVNRAALQLGSQFLYSFSGYRVVIIGKEPQIWEEVFVKERSEYRYQLVRIEDDGSSHVYREVKPTPTDYTVIDGIDAGRYQVRMLFFGLIVDQSSIFSVEQKISHVVGLRVAGSAVPVYFLVRSVDGEPVEGVWIRISGSRGQPIRGAPDFSSTGQDGMTHKALWVPPLLATEGNEYRAEIMSGDKVVTVETFSIEGGSSFLEKRLIHLTLENIDGD